MSGRQETDRRICILVSGMPGSGVSAAATTIGLLAARPPSRKTDPVDEAVADWTDWREPEPDEQRQHRRDDIVRLVGQDLGQWPLLVLRGPRVGHLVPYYAETLERTGYDVRHVLPTRNPLSVAASLNKRYGIAFEAALLLWLRYVLGAERATRGKVRVFLPYESLIADWRRAIDRIGAALGVAWPRPAADAAVFVEAFLSADFTHHAAGERELAADRRAVSWIRQAHAALAALEADPHDADAMQDFDRIRAAFDRHLDEWNLLAKEHGSEADAVQFCERAEVAMRTPAAVREWFALAILRRYGLLLLTRRALFLVRQEGFAGLLRRSRNFLVSEIVRIRKENAPASE